MAIMRRLFISLAFLAAFSLKAADADTTSTNATPAQTAPLTLQHREIWEDGVGNGFHQGVQSLTLQAGGVKGVKMFGGRQEHDLVLLSVSYGYMLGGLVAKDHWYQGNWEFRAELFGGAQVSPSRDGVGGLTPHIRYDFATGTHWVPYIDGGAGVSATGIGPPDLSGTFEFNLQLNGGVHWFVRDNLAVTFEAGYLHMSDAGIHDPNQGLNGVKGLAGVTWFF